MLKLQSVITNPLHFFGIAPVAFLWLITAITYGVFSWLYFQIPINPDDAVFAYIGWVMSEGGTTYVDAADQNWPGQMMIHWLAALLFGNELWAYRAFEIFIVLPLMSCILYQFAAAIYDRFSAVLVVLMFPVLYMLSGFWNAGQRDMLAGPLLIAACWMMYRRLHGAGYSSLVYQGLFITVATVIRPTMLIFGPLLFVVDLLFIARHQRTFIKIFLDHVIVAVTILGTAALLVLYGAMTGALAAWYEISILFATEVYSQSIGPIESLSRVIPNLLNSWKFYLIAAILGAALLVRKDRLALCLMGAILPAALVSLLVQGKALGYHLTVLYAPLSVLMAVGLSFSYQTLTKKKVALPVLILSLGLIAITAMSVAKKSLTSFASPLSYVIGKIDRDTHLAQYVAGDDVMVGDTVLLAEYIDETTPADAKVLFWGRPTHVNIVSGRPSPLREASIALLIEPTPDFSRYREWYERIDTMFKQVPPQILILAKDEDTGDYVGFDKLNPQKGFSSIVTKNLSRYQKEQVFGNTELYRLQK